MSDPTRDPAPTPRIPPIVLAPMLGVTTAIFRGVYRRHFTGVDRAVAPFLATTHGKQPPPRHFKDVLPRNNRDSLPLIPQLIGKDGEDFRHVANLLHDEFGYGEVNWNIGCPSPTVTSRGRGAGMLKDPDRVRAFLDAACADLRPRLSIKMRLGMDRDDECLVLADLLNGYPIAEVTVHPRTGRQQFHGTPDVERFADLRSRLRHPVAFNGDIGTTAGARDVCARFPGLSSVMIGRGVVVNPWLPAAIREGRPEGERRDLRALARFHDELYEAYRAALEGGAGPVLGRMKEVWTYWATVIPGARRILKSRGFADYEENVARVFDGDVPAHAPG